MKVEINVNDQLYVNDKWYFDIININDNIVQVRIKYKENPNIENYLYKSINLDKSFFDQVDKDESTKLIRVNLDEKKLRSTIGNLIDRIKIEIDYSFIYEDGGGAASVGNTGGFGAVVAPGVNPVPGQQGTPGSGDISTVLGPSTIKPADLLGKPYKKHQKSLKKKKKSKKQIKKPVLFAENYSEEDNDLKSELLDLINYPEKNEYDILFTNEIKNKIDELVKVSKETIKTYLANLIDFNNTKFKSCSEWLRNAIEKILE